MGAKRGTPFGSAGVESLRGEVASALRRPLFLNPLGAMNTKAHKTKQNKNGMKRYVC